MVMVVAAVLVGQRLQRRFDVGAVLDQALRADVGLTDFALGAVAAEAQVIAQRPGVLFPGQPDALGGLLLKPSIWPGRTTSITGLSPVGAAAILAETGDPRRFATGRAVVKHAGLAPREKLPGAFTRADPADRAGTPRAAPGGVAGGLGRPAS
jgi:hypothetical protein